MNELLEQYIADCNRDRKEYKEWYEKYKNIKDAERTYFMIDYDKYQTAIGEEIKQHFKLTDAQTGYIMGKAYEDYHSSFGDMFWGAYYLAEFVIGFPKN